MSSTMTLVGRLTAAPELRFAAQGGMAVASFTIVTSRRVKDQATGEWSDADTTYWDCKAFKQVAENCAESLDKGMDVVAVGRAVQESWEDKQTGAKRSKIVVRVDEVAVSLRRATAKVTRAQSGSGQQAYQAARQVQGRESVGDPWQSSTPGTQAGGAWEGSEPPF